MGRGEITGKFNLVQFLLNPLGIKGHAGAKGEFVGVWGSILTAFGIAVVSTGGTPLINLGSVFGFSAAIVGTLVGIAILLGLYDLFKGGKLYWKDIVAGALGGTIAVVLFAVAFGAVYSFSNYLGLLIGAIVLGGGVYLGVTAGDSLK